MQNKIDIKTNNSATPILSTARPINSIAVFCGSYSGSNGDYARTAEKVAAYLVDSGFTIVYGGGAVGLMGVVADTALANNGKVLGVMPRALIDAEIGHRGLTKMFMVENMHERKTLMADLADAFLALPGGAGTLEEMAEQWTWAQLGFHQKPCAFLNVRDYYSPFRQMANHMSAEGFMRQDYADMLIFEDEISKIVERLRRYIAPEKKWITSGKT